MSGLHRFGLVVLVALPGCRSQPTAEPTGKIRISRETTHLLEPLREDGTVHYAAAVNAVRGAGVTWDSNAAGPLAAILGFELEPETLVRLGAPGPVAREGVPRFRGGPGRYTAYLEWRAGQGHAGSKDPALLREFEPLFLEQLAAARQGPWRPEDRPTVAQWLEDNGPALDALAPVVRRPQRILDAPATFLSVAPQATSRTRSFDSRHLRLSGPRRPSSARSSSASGPRGSRLESAQTVPDSPSHPVAGWYAVARHRHAPTHTPDALKLVLLVLELERRFPTSHPHRRLTGSPRIPAGGAR